MTAEPVARSPLLARLAVNAASMISSEVVVRATSFVAYAVVGRRLGPYPFGQLSLGLSLLFLFQILASGGQRTLMVRDIARSPSGLRREMAAVAQIVAAGSVAVIVLLSAVMLTARWDRSTMVVVAVLFTSLPAYAYTQVLEGMMQGLEQMRFIALANIPLHLIKAAIAVVALLLGADVVTVAAIFAATYWFLLAVELAIIYRRLAPAVAAGGGRGRPGADPDGRRWARAQRNIRRGTSFLGVELVFALSSAAPLLITSAVAGEAAAGLLGAAQQAVMPLALAINSLVGVAFPAMCRAFERTVERTMEVVTTMSEALVSLVVPFITLTSVFAPTAIDLLYGNNGLDRAGELLRVIVWWSIVNALGTVMGQTLWALDLERQSMVIGMWTAAASVVANLAFIAVFGLDGVIPALATVSAVVLVLHYRQLRPALTLGRLAMALWRPAAATAAQVAVLFALRDWPLVRAALASLAMYTGVLAAAYLPGRHGRRPLPALLSALSAP